MPPPLALDLGLLVGQPDPFLAHVLAGLDIGSFDLDQSRHRTEVADLLVIAIFRNLLSHLDHVARRLRFDRQLDEPLFLTSS